MTTRVINSSPFAPQYVATMTNIAKATNAALAAPKSHCDNGAAGDTKYAITAANGAGTIAPLIKLTQQIVNTVRQHATDNFSAKGKTGTAAHKVVDATLAGTVTAASVTDLATSLVALNAVKAWYNTHRASTTYHYAADATNATAAADATDQASADTLANELKADINAHLALAFVDLPVLQSV